jgi:hypothetical protein
LVPRKVGFFSRNWIRLSTKDSLAQLLSGITRVDRKYLLQKEDIRSVSVAQRTAAAANRTTIRLEDMAYCLIGLFNVDMPLLYGEGCLEGYTISA